MDASKRRQRLKELATCSVCLDLMKEPKMLPCQHTFCLACLRSFNKGKTKESTRKICCAQCRSETTLPKGGFASLTPNIYVQTVLDLLRHEFSSGDVTKSSCEECQTLCQVKVCQHCSRSFCTICEQKHGIDLDHQLNTIREQLMSTKSQTERRIRSFIEICDQVKESVHFEIQNRMKLILETEKSLVEQIEEFCRREKTRRTDVVQILENNIENVNLILQGDPMINNSSEKVTSFMKIHRGSSECMESAGSFVMGSINFMPDTLTLTEDSEPIVEADELLDSKTSSASCSEKHLHSLESSMMVHPPQQSAVNDGSMDDEHSFYYRSRTFHARASLGSAFLQRPSGIAVSPWSREIFVVSMDAQRVYVFDIDKRRFLRSFGSRGQKVGEFICPYGIALSAATKEVLVTDKYKHCIHVFNDSERFIRQIGEKGSGEVQFKGPESISVDKEGKIYVCDTINNRIQVLNKEGEFVRDIDGYCGQQVSSKSLLGSTRRRRTLFQEPSGIAVDSDGQRLVVCDFNNHRIHLLSTDGSLVSTIGQKGLQRGQFVNPECVAIDRRGFLLVGDSGNSRVQIFRPDGRFVRTFGSKGSVNGHFNWISSITVTHNYEIVVADFKNHSVQVF